MDESGTIAWCGTYKAWGWAEHKHSKSTNLANIWNPVRLPGQYFDIETRLHYNRYRYYDPTIGRFTTKDPIGFIGGLNVYQFASNPVAWIDPLGLSPCREMLSKEKCKALIAKIYAKSTARKAASGNRGLLERVEDMREDKHDLYIFARETNQAKPYGQLAGKGSWDGHTKAATEIKSGLTQDILEFDKRGCNKHYKIPASIRRVASLEIPSSPERQK